MGQKPVEAPAPAPSYNNGPQVAPAYEPAPAPMPAAPAAAPVYNNYPPAPAPVFPADVKICTVCGNPCNKNAVVCVRCGQKFSGKEAGTTAKSGKAISVIAIILVALGLLTILSTAIAYESFSASTFLSLVSSVVILVGFIKGKCNKLPGIGYCISIVANLLSVLVDGSDFTFAFVLSLVQIGLTAAMFLGGNGIRKLWYLPVIFAALSSIVATVALAQYSSEVPYLLSVAIGSIFGSCIGVFVVCLNAKTNWNAPESAPMPPQY